MGAKASRGMVLWDAFPALRRGAFGVLQGIHIAHGARMAGMHSMRRYWIAARYIDSERAAFSKRIRAIARNAYVSTTSLS